MREFIVGILILLAGSKGIALGQVTQPSDGRLEYRAGQAFTRRDYATALRLYRELVPKLKDRPAKMPAVADRIAVCEKALASAKREEPQRPTAVRDDATSSDGSADSRQRKIHPVPAPEQVMEMTIQELGNFDYDPEKGGEIPEDVKRLSGAKLRLKGFMIPLQAGKIAQFALVPNLFSCCFGQPPTVQHTIACTVPRGMSVVYSMNQVLIEGTLTVAEKRDDGYVVCIFQLEAANVREAPHEQAGLK